LQQVTGDELKRIRQGLGRSVRDFALALGFEGEHAGTALRRYERGEKTIPPKVARLATMYQRYGIPADFE
jgi:transcriptional regulator with XRE-family HTH domain